MTIAEALELRPGDRVRHKHRLVTDIFVVLNVDGHINGLGAQSFVVVDVRNELDSPREGGWGAWSHLITEVNPYEDLEIGPDSDEEANA